MKRSVFSNHNFLEYENNDILVIFFSAFFLLRYNLVTLYYCFCLYLFC